MADVVRIGAGSILKMGSGASPPVFTKVAEVESIGAISEQRAEIKATPLDFGSERYIGGLKDGQPMEIGVFLLTDAPSQNAVTGIHSVFISNETRQWVVCGPVGFAKQYRFPAVITQHQIGPFTAGDAMRRNITLRLAGPVIEETNTNV
jgi:hypothetical protein